ncbi:MAG: aminoacyl-tRNA hydrolase [Rhodospirillales bacterium]
MRLLVGLGNPGPEYARNRHNVGFMAADEIVRRHDFSAFRGGKFQGELAEGVLGGRKILILKPMTYMNESGRSVHSCATFYRIAPEDIVVMHDELDLAGGKVRMKRGGGHAGHNGLRSIHAHLGEAYGRVRIGIGHPGDKARVKGYVLKDFSRAEMAWVEPMIDSIADNATYLAENDDARFQSRVAEDIRPVLEEIAAREARQKENG